MRRSTSLAVAAAVLVLAACTGGADPSPSTASTSSSSPPSTSSSTSAPPTTTTPSTTKGPADAYPAAARANTVAGGKAFVEFFFGVANAAFTTPQRGAISGISDESCQFCRKNESRVAELLSKSQKYAMEPVSVTQGEHFDGAPEGQEYYRVTLNQVGAPIVNAAGGVVSRDQKGTQPVNVVVVWRNSRWLLLGVEPI